MSSNAPRRGSVGSRERSGSDASFAGSEKFDLLLIKQQMNQLTKDYEIALLAPTDSIADALDKLKKVGILSAPVVDQTDGKYEVLGLFDCTDCAYFCISLLQEKCPNGPPADSASIGVLNKQFFSTPVKQVVNFSQKNPYKPRPKDTPLYNALEQFGEGLHRIPLVDPQTGRITKVISQIDVVHFLHNNTKRLGKLSNETIANLQLKRDKVVSVSTKGLTMEAFFNMKTNNVSSCALLDDGDKMFTTLSTSDFKYVTDISILLQPIMNFVSFVRLQSVDEKAPSIECKPTATYKDVIAKLSATKVHRLFVVDEAKHCIGVVSLTDILQVLIPKHELDGISPLGETSQLAKVV